MTELMRVRIRWSGFSGAPGYTVLHFRDFDAAGGGGGSVTLQGAQGAVQRAQVFATGIASALPATVTLQVDGQVDVLEDTTGDLVNSFNGGLPEPVTGAVAGTYSAAVGAVINWRTGGIRNGRRVRGRSFIVPLAGSCFDNTGQLTAAAQADIQDAANTLAGNTGSPDLFVYARPVDADDATPTRPAAPGQASAVTSAQVPRLGAVLRSRRD